MLKELLKLQRQTQRAVRNEARALQARGEDIDPVALALDIAARNAAGPVAKKNIKQTQILYDREAGQAPALPVAVGDPGDLDIAQMNRNYLKWTEGADDDGEEI